MLKLDFNFKNNYLILSPSILFRCSIIGFLLLCSACLKTENYSNTPLIGYKNFVAYGKDSADFIFTFKDGDGDIGLQQSDTSGVFSISGAYYYNCFMKYYYKQAKGRFSTYITPSNNDTLVYKYRIPYITPVGQKKIVDGEVRVRLYAPYYVIEQTPPHTIISFEVFIYDRALNKSNVVLTPEIKVP